MTFNRYNAKCIKARITNSFYIITKLRKARTFYFLQLAEKVNVIGNSFLLEITIISPLSASKP
jgi:hypothetical protein